MICIVAFERIHEAIVFAIRVEIVGNSRAIRIDRNQGCPAVVRVIGIIKTVFVGVITGLWYGAGALGYFVSGEIGALWSSWSTQRVLLLLTALPTVGAVVLAILTRQPSASRTEP